MNIEIRKPLETDKEAFINLSCELTKFNKRQHAKHYDDLKKVHAIRKEHVSKTFDAMEKRPGLFIRLAFCNGLPTGYVRAFIIDYKLKTACLDELYIKDSLRGKGIGKKLLESVTLWMKEKEIVRMTVSVYKWNEEAIRFYEKEGFESFALSYEKNLTEEEN